MIGFEAFEPTGLYQYSLAYDLQLPSYGGAPLTDGVGSVEIIPGYAQGVKYTYESDTTFFGISIQDEVFDNDNDRFGGDDDGSYGAEVAFALTMDNGFSWFVGGAYEDADAGDSYMLNTYVTFETGAWLFAAELNYGESEADAFAIGGIAGLGEDEDVLQGLLMANFAYSDAASITGRLSYVSHEYDSADLDAVKFTLAHGYAFTDNLFLVNEISYVDGNLDGFGADTDFDSVLFATELIFSF
jgi:hypothetical protein